MSTVNAPTSTHVIGIRAREYYTLVKAIQPASPPLSSGPAAVGAHTALFRRSGGTARRNPRHLSSPRHFVLRAPAHVKTALKRPLAYTFGYLSHRPVHCHAL